LTYIIERLIVLKKVRGKVSPDEMVEEVRNIFKQAENKEVALEKAISYCNELKSPLTNILREALVRHKEDVKIGVSPDKYAELIKEAVQDAGQKEIPILESHLSVLETVGKVAPLMGLLGTIMGMIKAFNTIALNPAGVRPDQLAGGISEALITTQAGLMIAVPVIVFYSIFRNKIDGYINEVETSTIDLIDTLLLRGEK
jgi:biopolymer transport protein ExbB